MLRKLCAKIWSESHTITTSMQDYFKIKRNPLKRPCSAGCFNEQNPMQMAPCFTASIRYTAEIVFSETASNSWRLLSALPGFECNNFYLQSSAPNTDNHQTDNSDQDQCKLSCQICCSRTTSKWKVCDLH